MKLNNFFRHASLIIGIILGSDSIEYIRIQSHYYCW